MSIEIPNFSSIGPSLNWARNGICPPADAVRALADSLHYLACLRPKYVSEKSLPAASAYYGDADHVIGRWMGHTGPLTTTATFIVVYAPSRGTNQDATPGVWLVSETGFSGVGATVVHPTMNTGGGDFGATAVPPDRLQVASQVLPVSPDTTYRWTLHTIAGYRVCGWTMIESRRSVLDTTTDTLAVVTAQIARGLPVYDATALKIIALADKVYRRGGKSLFTWTEETAITLTTAAAENLLDPTLSAWSSTSPGWGTDTECMGTLAGPAVVPIVFYVHGSIPSGSGVVRLVSIDGTITYVEVDSATPGWWYSTSGVLVGSASSKLDIIVDDGATDLSLDAAGAFVYGA